MNRIITLFQNKLSKTEAILVSFALGILFVYPLLHADIYYEDDLFRIFTGQYVWEMLGRIFTYYLMHIVTFSYGSMLNVTPLPLLLSCVVIALTIYYVSKELLNGHNLISIFVSFCFVCNPYMLSNLSYAYDSLHMVLGFFFSVFSFCEIKKGKKVGVIWLVSAFLFYQPMANVFLSLVFFSLFVDLVNNVEFKNIYRSLLKYLSVYILSILFYYLSLKIFYAITSHKLQRSEMLSIYDLLFDGVFFNRVLDIYNYLSVLFKNAEGMIITCLLTFTFLLSIFNLNGLKRLPLVFIVLIGLFLSLFGPMFILKEGLITARVMTSLGGIIFTFLYAGIHLINKDSATIKIISLSSIIMTTWYFITLSFGYGNTISDQRKYDENIASLVQYDVISLKDNVKDKLIYLEGCPARPRSVQLSERFRPFYTQLHYPACTWRTRFIMYNDILGNFKFDYRWDRNYPDIKKKICDSKLNPIVNRDIYKIYSGNDFIFIDLKNEVKCH